jgi:drug/metabolite transporter (DMT)-like permease
MAGAFSWQGLIICTIFTLIGPSLILVNQYILKALHFPYPIFLSGLGVVTSGLTAKLIVQLGFVKMQRAEAIEGWLWYKRVLPVGLSTAATLSLGNMVYLYLDVGFIQMLKSFTPVLLVLTGYLTGIETANWSTILSVIVISAGTATTCTYTPQLHMLGLFLMFLSSLTEAIKLVITQFFLQNLKFGVVESQYILSPAAAFWLFVASIFTELPDMLEHNAFTIVYDHIWMFILASIMGVGVNFITYFVIQYTSSLTMKILGTLRNILMIVVGVVVYQEVITFYQSFGYFIALVGFVGYNLSKMGYFDRVEIPCLSEPMKRLTRQFRSREKLEDNFVPADEEELGLLTKHLDGSNGLTLSLKSFSSGNNSPYS